MIEHSFSTRGAMYEKAKVFKNPFSDVNDGEFI